MRALGRPGLRRDTLLNLAGLALPILLQFGTLPFYIRAIGAERYGIMALVWLLLGYFGLFDLGFGRALANRIAVLRHAAPARAADVFWTGCSLSIIAGAVGGLILYLAAAWLFGDVFAVPHGLRAQTLACLPLIALALPILTGSSALAGALQGCAAFGALNLAQMVGGGLCLLFPLLVSIFISPALPRLIMAVIAGRLVTAIMLFMFWRTHGQALNRPRFVPAEIPALLSYGGWVTLTGLVSPLLTVFDRFMIGAIAGMTAVTAYSIPFNLVMRMALVPSSLQNALFPRFAAADAAAAQTLQRQALRVTACATTPLLLVGLLFMKPLLMLWLGRALAGTAVPVGQILVLGLWANSLAFIPFGFLQSRGRPDVPAKFHVLEVLFYAPLLLVLTRQDGVAGAAAAWDIRTFADAALLCSAVHLLPGLLACWFGLVLVALQFAWVRLDVQMPLLYWSGGAALISAGVGWAVLALPPGLKVRLSRRLGGTGLRAVPS